MEYMDGGAKEETYGAGMQEKNERNDRFEQVPDERGYGC